VMSWAPQMSGKTEAEAVADLDEALCTVCFPTAPVALHNYVSRRTTAERDERAAAKAERDAAKAAKTLEPGQRFKDHGGWTVETVAAAKKAVRDEIEARAWYPRSHADYVQPALDAERVLLAREATRPGTGATAAEIATIKASTERRVQRELSRAR
jgi:hypothetical protein